MENQGIEKILIALNEAQQNLQDIHKEFSGDSVLLQIYGASAEEAVKIYQKRLEVALATQTHMNVSVSGDNDVDFWIHVEGDDFHDGKGPVAFIGNYLNKLNTACKDTIRLFGQSVSIGREDSVFYLAGLAAGSLKIGVKKCNSTNIPPHDEVNLFADEEKWENLRQVAKKNNNIENAIMRLMETMESANSEEQLMNLRDKIGDDDKFLKLLNYARELAPSNKSGISCISFETGKKSVRIGQGTRGLIREYAKKLLPGKQYVSGIAFIRSQDIDTRKVIARPFNYEDKTINDLECILPAETPSNIYLNQIIEVTGFLVKTKNNNNPKLEIDTINMELQDDD